MLKFEQAQSRRQTFGQLLWFCGWLALTLFAVFLRPDAHHHGTHTQLGLPPCASVMLFGRPCPGCGMTTSITAFAHGQIGAAFVAHPFGPIMYVLYTLSAWTAAWSWKKGLIMNANTKAVNTTIVCVLVAFMIFGAIRFATTSGLQWAYGPWESGRSATR
jgi:hypothetical protein